MEKAKVIQTRNRNSIRKRKNTGGRHICTVGNQEVMDATQKPGEETSLKNQKSRVSHRSQKKVKAGKYHRDNGIGADKREDPRVLCLEAGSKRRRFKGEQDLSSGACPAGLTKKAFWKKLRND